MENYDERLVYHPLHYNKEGRPECWDEMERIFGTEAVVIFDCLSAFKYYYRAGAKDGNPEAQDLAKIRNYMMHAEKKLNERNLYSFWCNTHNMAKESLLKMKNILDDNDGVVDKEDCK